MADGIAPKIGAAGAESSLWLSRAGDVQLFNFQWLVRSDAGSLFLLFTDSLPHPTVINQSFFEQLSPLSSLVRCPKRVFPSLALSGEDNATIARLLFICLSTQSALSYTVPQV